MRALPGPIRNGILCALALGITTIAVPELPNNRGLARSSDLVLVDARCGHGWHYVPQGYAKHGKWRDAHCSRN